MPVTSKHNSFLVRATIFIFAIFVLNFSGLGCGKVGGVDRTAKGRITSARNLASQNRIEDAIGELKAAAEAEPANFEAHYELGALYYKTKDFDSAQASLKKALALKSNEPKIHNMLGLVFEKQGRFDSAKRSFQEALHLDKKFDEARQNLSAIEEAKLEHGFYKFALEFIYVLSKEYSNGNNSFMRGVNESRPVKNEFGTILKYEVSSDVYLAKEYFDKCSKLLEEMADRASVKSASEIIEAFSAAIQQRQEAIDLQVQGYAMTGSYAGEFERASAKVKIADTYYVDSARKLESLMLERPGLFDEKEFANIKFLINYYSQEKAKEIEPLR